jgi:hypothetical protein
MKSLPMVRKPLISLIFPRALPGPPRIIKHNCWLRLCPPHEMSLPRGWSVPQTSYSLCQLFLCVCSKLFKDNDFQFRKMALKFRLRGLSNSSYAALKFRLYESQSLQLLHLSALKKTNQLSILSIRRPAGENWVIPGSDERI